MWNLTANDLLKLQGSGGVPFADFMNRLIRAEAMRCGLAQSEIQTQNRTNISDGGIDAVVHKPIVSKNWDWFSTPTCWQFKAEMTSTRPQLKKEINKGFVKELLLQGYAYRLCILGDLTAKKLKSKAPSKVESWEQLLQEEAAKINPAAPPPRVIHGGDLIHWAGEFPALVKQLRPELIPGILWDVWSAACREVTPHYVANAAWQEARSKIHSHVDFSAVCKLACLAIGGEAGVGKTRLVFESLAEIDAAPGLVIQTFDDQTAKQFAAFFAAIGENRNVILVADECLPETEEALNNMLLGHTKRIRVICMNTSRARLPTASRPVWLKSRDLTNTVEILKANFPLVSEDRLRRNADIAGGFVRLAADMCEHEPESSHAAHLEIPDRITTYVELRLGEFRPLISFIALFHKVGFKDDVEDELQALCRMSGQHAQQFRDAVRSVKESPGFVVQAGRYWYISPQIVAQLLFNEGWNHWVKNDLKSFFSNLPEPLVAQFIERAGQLGKVEVRDSVAAFFRFWFGSLTIEQLADSAAIRRIEAVVENAPGEFLPQLRSLIEYSSGERLLGILGDSPTASWGPRRTVVWLLERLVSFQEYFVDCEACLFQLALYESEPSIGNNATAVWRNLFGVHLSGTAAPFAARLEILKERIRNSTGAALTLAFQSLKDILQPATGHIVGPSLVSGRMRPPEWTPASQTEERACYRMVLEFCSELMREHGTVRRELAVHTLIRRIIFLVRKGLLGVLMDVLRPDRLSVDESAQLLRELDRFLEATLTLEPERIDEKRPYAAKLREWLALFRRSDLDGRLRELCAREPWDRRFAYERAATTDEMDVLAGEIVQNPRRLEPHLEWLGTAEATSAERLGFAVARLDDSFICAELIFRQSIEFNTAALLRGYVRGVVSSRRSPSQGVLDLMDQLQASRPEIAADILVVGGDDFDAVNRVLQLVETALLTPNWLSTFAMGVGSRWLTVSEIGRILAPMVKSAASGDQYSVEAGIRFVYRVLRNEERHTTGRCLDETTICGDVVTLIEHATHLVGKRLSSEWAHIAKALAGYDAQKVIPMLASALASDSLALADEAEKSLEELIPTHGQEVLEGFGSVLLDPDQGWRLQIRVYRDLVRQLSSGSVLDWIRGRGLAAARAIARHLPAPYIDGEGNPIVPHLLDVVLREFDDEKVLLNFQCGMHSHEAWNGDDSARFRQEADEARMFLRHPNPRIREWATAEIADRMAFAEMEDRQSEEQFLPS